MFTPGAPVCRVRRGWAHHGSNRSVRASTEPPVLDVVLGLASTPRCLLVPLPTCMHGPDAQPRPSFPPSLSNNQCTATEKHAATTRYLCDYIADRYKAEPSLSQAGLWATLLTDVLVTARERAYGSIADQSVDRLCALASRLDLAVREDVFNDATVRDVQRCDVPALFVLSFFRFSFFFFFVALSFPLGIFVSVWCSFFLSCRLVECALRTSMVRRSVLSRVVGCLVCLPGDDVIRSPRRNDR